MPESFKYLVDEDRTQVKELARLIARKDWVLFAGSGISRRSGLPLWKDLVERMIERLRPGEVKSNNPLEVASIFEANLDRVILIEFLRDNLQIPGSHPNPLHDRLLDLRPPVIVTTNFDDLFERALEQRGMPYAIAISDSDLSSIGDRLPLLKPHGDLQYRDFLVFTGHDYVMYPQQELVNMKLCTLAAQHSFFFVGYSLSDPDLEHQMQRVLEAQGELARPHYLVVDEIDSLRRNTLLKQRRIHAIALGSYDLLEQFLVDLLTEAERIRLSEEAAALPHSTRSTEALELSAADRRLLEFLQEDYEPVIEALDQLRFVDAEEHLQCILTKIKKVKTDPASNRRSELDDFHQRVLLALAAVAGRRSRYEEARTLFHQAKELQPFSGKRRLQAAEVLMILGEFQEVEALLAKSAEALATREREILGLVALFRDNEAGFRALYPDGHEQNAEFGIAQASLAVRSSTDVTAKSAVDLLDKAWRSSQDFLLGLFTVACLTDEILRRIIAGEWEAPGVNRGELLQTVRERYQYVLDAFERLADQYQEGLVAVLSQLLDFHRILEEKEAQRDLLARLQSLPVMTRERPFTEHLAGKPSPGLEVIETLFQRSYLSDCEKSLLTGATLIQEGNIREAEQVYRQALSNSENPGDRHALIQSLLELLLKEERYEEAFAFLEESTAPTEGFRALMRGMILLSHKDQEGALTVLREALDRHPRNMLLLENLVRLLSSQIETDGVTSSTTTKEENQKNILAEALQYAERLEALLPSFEHKILRARLLGQSGCYGDAPRILEEVERERYVTLQALSLKCELLHKLGRNREAAELLGKYRDRYPGNYLLCFHQATAWAQAGEIERAIAISEELRNRPEADGDLYLNLFVFYIQRGSLDPAAFSRAFDIAKEALEKFPDRREFAAGLVQAAIGSGRSREAWEIIGRRPDLREGPYLRAVPEKEAIEIFVRETKTLQDIEAVYRAGGIPFSAYAAHSPRAALFVWQARLHLWRKGNQASLLLCSFPHITRESRQLLNSTEGIILDITTLLTLGSLNVTREVLEALQQTGKRIFLFPGARRWLEEEAGRLSLNQLPDYRERHKHLRDRLLTSRERVEIFTRVEGRENSLEESVRQRLGIFAWDVELAAVCKASYVDDYLPLEDREDLPQDMVISSADFLATLEEAGVIFSEETERIRNEHPEPFAKARTGATIALGKPMVFSSLTLIAWFEAGLLERWLRGDPGWPPKLMVGPIAWSQLEREVSEGEIYREALQLASSLRTNITEALTSGIVQELPPTDPPDLGGHPALRPLFAPTFTLFVEARARKFALWTDDLCTRLLVDYRGPLLQEQPLIDIAARACHAFSTVPVAGTEDILSWLESTGLFSRERRLNLLWQLHKAGYRFLDIGDALLWLLGRFRYDRKAVPVAELLHDLEMMPMLNLPNVDSKRLRFFIDFSRSAVLSRAISGLWYLKDSALTGTMRKEISAELVDLFERAISP